MALPERRRRSEQNFVQEVFAPAEVLRYGAPPLSLDP
jgi:hypothetical protein